MTQPASPNGQRPRIAVVGCGMQARGVLIPALLVAGANLSVLCDVAAEHAELAARLGARFCSEADELVDEPDLDGFVLAAHSTAHTELLAKLIPSGRPIFVEKPAGLSTAELTGSVECARSNAASVQVGFMRRFAPSYRQTEQLARAWRGSLACQVRASCGPYPSDEYFVKDVAVHFVDLARFLAGEVGEVVARWSAPREGSGRSVHALFCCEGGTVGLFLSHGGSWGHPTEELWLEGSGGVVQVTNVTDFRYHRAGRLAPSDDRAKRRRVSSGTAGGRHERETRSAHVPSEHHDERDASRHHRVA